MREKTRGGGVPWSEAIQTFGLDRIRTLGTKQQVSNWKQREKYVPWDHVGPELLKHYKKTAFGTPHAPKRLDRLTEVRDVDRDDIKVVDFLKELKEKQPDLYRVVRELISVLAASRSDK